MKKERNAFFSNYTSQNTSYFPNTPPNMPIPQNNPYYNVDNNYYGTNDISNYNEIDNRLNKLERVVNRLESRVTKLENSLLTNQQPTTNNYSNMYML